MNRKYRLLIVDDELANLQKLQRAFVSRYDIYPALSGAEALKIMENTPVDAIITDQKMPDMTGIELLEISG
jgi:YesN/AraC family two-component response regulator